MKTKILSVLMSLGIIAMTLPITVFAELPIESVKASVTDPKAPFTYTLIVVLWNGNLAGIHLSFAKFELH